MQTAPCSRVPMQPRMVALQRRVEELEARLSEAGGVAADALRQAELARGRQLEAERQADEGAR